MFAARIDAIISPSAPGNSSCRHAKPNAFSGSPSAALCPCATMAATIRPTSAQPTVQTRFTKLPKNIPTRQVRSSLPVPTAASWCGCAMMPDQAVDRQHRDHPRADAGRRGERKPERLERRLHPGQAADHPPAERNQHEREHDDQDALKQIGPRRRDQSADEAVEHEHHGHRDDDLVHADAAAGRLADHLAGALEHAAGVDDEEAEREDDVDAAHPRSVAILRELRHRRPPDAAEHRRHDPVERRDEEVLPLEPDAPTRRGVYTAPASATGISACVPTPKL